MVNSQHDLMNKQGLEAENYKCFINMKFEI